jgi:hypothetical protein
MSPRYNMVFPEYHFPNAHSTLLWRCPLGAERWYESLRTTFASRREVPHLPPPFRSGQDGLNTSLMKGLTAAGLPRESRERDRGSASRAPRGLLLRALAGEHQGTDLDEGQVGAHHSQALEAHLAHLPRVCL